MTGDTISDCTTGRLTDRLILRICRRIAKQQETVHVMCVFIEHAEDHEEQWQLFSQAIIDSAVDQWAEEELIRKDGSQTIHGS